MQTYRSGISVLYSVKYPHNNDCDKHQCVFVLLQASSGSEDVSLDKDEIQNAVTMANLEADLEYQSMH